MLRTEGMFGRVLTWYVDRSNYQSIHMQGLEIESVPVVVVAAANEEFGGLNVSRT